MARNLEKKETFGLANNDSQKSAEEAAASRKSNKEDYSLGKYVVKAKETK